MSGAGEGARLRLSAAALDRRDLSERDRAAMLALMRRCYDGVDAEIFARDLEAKSRVVVLRGGDGELLGFSTLALFDFEAEGAPARAIFSGDTVIAPEAWGSPAFAFAWVREAARIARLGEAPLYWLLIVKGHRTFRFLPTFTRRFAPHWAQDDAGLLALRDRLARARFGARYDAARGVLRPGPAGERLTAAFAEPSPREAARPDVRFFLERNPGYRRGEELVCLCPLAPDNLRPTTLRLFEAA